MKRKIKETEKKERKIVETSVEKDRLKLDNREERKGKEKEEIQREDNRD